jgi:hypothetical protein
MCGGRRTDDFMSAVGVMNNLKRYGWVSLADELAELSESDFQKLMEAFKVYRKHIKDQQRDIHPTFPQRKNRNTVKE